MTGSKRKQRLPLTPASSAEITALDHTQDYAKHDKDLAEIAFSLPPAAISTGTEPFPRGTESGQLGQHPLSPTSPRISTTRDHDLRPTPTKRSAPEFELPPPPTRARKIIQMKPNPQQDAKQPEQPEQQPRNNKTNKANRNSSNSSSKAASSASPAKKKQSTSNTTSTGTRKVARKTAHSLIERRRRSKMNEEFGTLKDMIPACKDEDMHKLAILQAGIEYMSYLEQCIVDLKAANKRKEEETASLRQSSAHQENDQARDQTRHTQISPTLGPTNDHTLSRRTSTEQAPRWVHRSEVGPQSACTSTTTSPVVQPQDSSFQPPSLHLGRGADLDHEASAALLMLNKVDSRKLDSDESRDKPTPQEPQRKLGISVKDLLSH